MFEIVFEGSKSVSNTQNIYLEKENTRLVKKLKALLIVQKA
jgi:hypothetical protein